METKICTGPCGAAKPLSDYGKQNNKRKDGTISTVYRGECKGCRKVKIAKSNAAKVQTQSKPDRCANPDCICPTDKLEFQLRENKAYRSECKMCVAKRCKEQEYSQKSRQKRLAADPEGFRAHNKKVHRAWLEQHPEKRAEYQRNQAASAKTRMKAIIARVRSKCKDDTELEEQLVLDDVEAMQAKMSEPCHYCDHEPDEGDRLNGLDRVNPQGPYSDANTVACCAACNFMKANYAIDEFISGVHGIAANHDLGRCDTSLPLPCFGGTHDRRSSAEKVKTLLLTHDERIELWSAPCFMCGRGPSLGIDRICCAGNYEMSNVRPCCSQCNYMRKDFDDEVFFAHIARIYNLTKMWVIGDVSQVLTTCCGQHSQPVAVTFNDQTLILPSQYIARQWRLSRVLGKWSQASVQQYREQCMCPEKAAIVLKGVML